MVTLMKLKISAACLAAAALINLISFDISAQDELVRPDTGDIVINIDVSRGRKEISPLIYGINDTPGALDGISATALKQTSYALSSYNWETNFANFGAAGNNSNDISLVGNYARNLRGTPALFARGLVSKAVNGGIGSKYITLQMMGYVAKDGLGEIRAEDVIEDRFDRISFEKNDTYLIAPDTGDNEVYIDEYISFLVNRYGYAEGGGISGYFLDSEPEMWSERFPALDLPPLTAEGLVNKSVRLAETVKVIDPSAMVFGPSVSGLEAFVNLCSASDWEKHSPRYSWFIDYYLSRMAQASASSGVRLLDVLDLHFFTSAVNPQKISIIGASDYLSNSERMHATGIFWDNSYSENTPASILYKQHTPIIPTLQASIRMYNPGVKLSFSEYDFGGGGDISGGVAQADLLGIFASQGVYMACLRPSSPDIDWQKAGINIYTNYDGAGSGFGNVLVFSDNGGDSNSAVYSAISGDDDTSLKTVVINKNMADMKSARITINSEAVYESASVYCFNSSGPGIEKTDEIGVENNSFEYEFTPSSVYMFEFSGSDELDEITAISSELSESSEPAESSEPQSVSYAFSSGSGVTDVSGVVGSSGSETVASVTPRSGEPTGETESAGFSSETLQTENSILPIAETVPDASAADDFRQEEMSEPDAGASVPGFVKVIVAALVGVVILFMIYVLIYDVKLKK